MTHERVSEKMTSSVYAEALGTVLFSGCGEEGMAGRRGSHRHAATAPVTATAAATHALRVRPATKASVAAVSRWLLTAGLACRPARTAATTLSVAADGTPVAPAWASA